MRRLLYLIVICLFVFTIALLSTRFREPVYISKASFPSWDLLEIGLKRGVGGKRFEFSNFSNYSDVMEEFISKRSNLATLTIFEALLAYHRLDANVVIILMLDYTIGSDGILAHKGIYHPINIKSKVIGAERDTIAHYTLTKLLQRVNLDHKDIVVVNKNTQELIQLFKEKKLDAISFYDPYLYELRNLKKEYNLLFTSKEIPGKICDVLIAHKDFAINHPELIKSLREKWFKIVRDGDPYKVLQGRPGYKNESYLEHIKQNIYLSGKLENLAAFGTSEDPGYLYGAINDMAGYLKQQGSISKEFSIPSTILLKMAESNDK